ncbi:MAG: hypothetical protein JWP89_5742 [Schlesneria sp.]|nr:hypothetical protein [Schlesneria sp.]
MMACAFLVGWVRSLLVSDILCVDRHVFGSNSGVLSWVLCQDESNGYYTSKPDPEFLTSLKIEWSLGWGNFRIGEGRNANPTANAIKFAFAPYWSMTLLLTLLSAYLILWKPRKRPSPN